MLKSDNGFYLFYDGIDLYWFFVCVRNVSPERCMRDAGMKISIHIF